MIGAGQRGAQVYGAFARRNPNDIVFVAVAEPDEARRKEFCRDHGICPDNAVEDWHELLARPKMADCAFVCTQDNQHIAPAMAALQAGYHVVMEKPMSRHADELRALKALAEEKGKLVTVCHVLRYTPFFSKVKELLDAGEIGQLQSVQQIENVAYWHQAHSFVRGNWRNSNTTSPMILQKCCHDMDLLLWLTGKTCESVSSFGDTYLFKPQCAPEGAALRCLDGCKAKDHCPFDAEKIYLKDPKIGVENGYTQWPVNVLTLHPTVESVTQAIQNGPYGRCVYHCDNNVVDHQVVNLKMTDGSTISHTMCAFTATGSRYAKFMGTMGEIIADMTANTIQITPFGKDTETIDINQIASDFFGHGGGDKRMVEDFIDMLLLGNGPSGHTTTVEQSVESHYCAFAAEESRLHNGAVVELDKFRK
mgnify:CR=1 FL=1